MMDVNGHEAGNGGDSQGKSTAPRASSTRRWESHGRTWYPGTSEKGSEHACYTQESHRPVDTDLVTLMAPRSKAALPDSELTDQEKKEGWILLFDGKSGNGWMTSGWEACPEVVDQGAINPSKCPRLGAGGWDMVYERPWTNFVLQLDFKISPNTNSGVMVRIWPLRALPGFDVEYNGLEVQILDSRTAGYYDTGAIYDLVKPTTNAMRPVGEWNHLRISCDRSILEVWVNGTHVNRMNLDDWTQPFERPDGTEHKFNIASKYHPHGGYIGLQKHEGNRWFKNIKLKPLNECVCRRVLHRRRPIIGFTPN